MFETLLDTNVIKESVQLACRAPSLHNSQPWRWVIRGGRLDLFADPARIGHHTDNTGREVLISCGAVLDHLRVAAAAAGWSASIDRFPNPNDRNHLASLEFRQTDVVSDAERALAGAIGTRRTDRLPFAAPADWDAFETLLRNITDHRAVDLDVIDDNGRPALADVSRRTEQLRRSDASYQAELMWWTGYSEPSEGIPPSALVSEADTERVDVARHFPAAGDDNRRPGVDRDHSLVLVLSTHDDSRECALRCGEVLSTVLLECTAVGLATCTLTHMIEVNASREAIRRLTGNVAEPQVLIRVGSVPQTEPPPPPTPRRPLSDVLEIPSATTPADFGRGAPRSHPPGVDALGNQPIALKGAVVSDHALEVTRWDPEDHTDLPGFAHGLTRYGGYWFDVGISVVPRDVDPLEALDKVFAKLREIVVSERPDITYFTVDLRVASNTPVPHPR